MVFQLERLDARARKGDKIVVNKVKNPELVEEGIKPGTEIIEVRRPGPITDGYGGSGGSAQTT